MLRQQFLQGDAGVFDGALGERGVAALVTELAEPYRERIYPPLETLRLFVSQVLSADREGRSVKLFDGTLVSMPDTPSNQRAYPQSREQKPGLGFPLARIGALIGLASGAILRYQVAGCEGKGTGEQSLLANLLDHLNASDVVLADALLASGWIVEGASRRGVDGVMA